MAEMVLLNPGLILQAHQEGRQVFIWFSVIENPFGLSFMRFFGADGLIVDDPTSVRER
jgi:glycerophosphoryl diester phosphodiesterase